MGYFWSYKYGSTRNNFTLDDLRDGTEPYAEHNLYYGLAVYGYSYPWTLEDGHDNTEVDYFGKKKVKFELTDDRFTFNGNEELLTKDDFEISSINFSCSMSDAYFDEEDLQFVSKSVTYDADDVLTFEAKFGDSTEFVTFAAYHFKSGSREIADEYRSYVQSFSSSEIRFTDAAQCTGFRISTENAHYFTGIYATPHCRVKPSEYILSAAGDLQKVYLENTSTGAAYSGEKLVFSRTCSAKDYLLGDQRITELEKWSSSTQNNKLKKYVAVQWGVSLCETLETDEGLSNIQQESGRFYDLLPIGCEPDVSSVYVVGDGHRLPESAYDVSIVRDFIASGRTMLIVDVKESAEQYILYYSTNYSWENFNDYGTVLQNTVAYETGNEKLGSGLPDNGGGLSDSELMNDLDPDTDAKRFVYAQHSKAINYLLTTASTGLSKKVVSYNGSAVYSTETTVGKDNHYSYKLRLASNSTSSAKNVFLYDSLENYRVNGQASDWKGILTDVDIAQPVLMGAAPVVYYSPIENLDLTAHNNRNCCLTINDTGGQNEAVFSKYNDNGDRIWYTEEELIAGFGSLAAAKAVCVDLSHDANGEPFILAPDSSLTVILNMVSPSADESNSADPCAYNSVNVFNSVISEFGGEENHYIQYNYTRTHFRIVADFGIYKADATDLSVPVKDIRFVLEGRSDYGKDVYLYYPTDKNGRILFKNIEKGTYKLYETYGSIDYQALRDNMEVVVDGDGNVIVDGASGLTDVSPTPVGGKFTDGYYTVPNKPRVHTDIQFYKRSTVSRVEGVPAVQFRLMGVSDYGNMVRETAYSQMDGSVHFYNIEPGSYTLAETEVPEGFIDDELEYRLIVDENGNYSIEGLTRNTDGDFVIYNEPYHSFTIQKIDYDTQGALPGAEFTLTGTSDRGTVVNETLTSGENGRLIFENLEKGSYILQETHQPDGYFEDNTRRIVTVKETGEITIEGMNRNKLGYFIADNKKNGTITIVKKWEDDKENEDRPTPVIHLSSNNGARPTTATFLGKTETGPALGRISGANNRSVTKFRQSPTAPAASVRTTRMDDQTTDSKILCWVSNDTIYWWSDAHEVYFPFDSSRFFYYMYYLRQIDVTGISTAKVRFMNEMFANNSAYLTSLDLSSFDTSKVLDMNSMFANCTSLASLNLSGWDTSNVSDMSKMFYRCFSLAAITTGSWDTSKVTNMESMFFYCQALTAFDVTGWDTSAVTNMNSMFYFCQKLNFDPSGFVVDNFNNMESMFSHCDKLKNLDLSGWKTSKVHDATYMFYDCQGLETLNVNGWDFSYVDDDIVYSTDFEVESMFSNCTNLKTLYARDWSLPNTKSLNYLFQNCSSLTTLDISGWMVEYVESMAGMFDGCSSLTVLDFSTWQLYSFNPEVVYSMFQDCSSLQTIYVSQSFDLSSTSGYYMFDGCNSLVGGQGTPYDEYNTNQSYAHIDDPDNGNPGYFTEKTDGSSGSSQPASSNEVTLISSLKDCINSSAQHFKRYTGSEASVSQISDKTRVDDQSTDKKAYVWYDSAARTMYWWSDAETVYLPSSCYRLFYQKTSLIDIDLTGLDSSKVTDMSYMFYNCTNLTDVNLRGLDTSNVTNMSYMFYFCGKLTSLDLRFQHDQGHQYGLYVLYLQSVKNHYCH